MNDKLDPEMMGRSNPGMKGSMKNGNGSMHNGNGHHPLPPDGMYHVSEGNGHGMNGFNGGMPNGMDNGNALAAALTDKVRLQLKHQMEDDLEDLLPPPPPSMQDNLPTSAMQQSVVLNNKQGPRMIVQNSVNPQGEGDNKNGFGQDNSQMNSLHLPGRLPPSTCV